MFLPLAISVKAGSLFLPDEFSVYKWGLVRIESSLDLKEKTLLRCSLPRRDDVYGKVPCAHLPCVPRGAATNSLLLLRLPINVDS